MIADEEVASRGGGSSVQITAREDYVHGVLEENFQRRNAPLSAINNVQDTGEELLKALLSLLLVSEQLVGKAEVVQDGKVEKVAPNHVFLEAGSKFVELHSF